MHPEPLLIKWWDRGQFPRCWVKNRPLQIIRANTAAFHLTQMNQSE